MRSSQLRPFVRRAVDRHRVPGLGLGLAGTKPARIAKVESRSALMLVSCRGTALVRQARPLAVNDNVPRSAMPDDRPFLLALALIGAGIVALAAYVALSGPDDVMAMLRR